MVNKVSLKLLILKKNNLTYLLTKKLFNICTVFLSKKIALRGAMGEKFEEDSHVRNRKRSNRRQGI